MALTSGRGNICQCGRGQRAGQYVGTQDFSLIVPARCLTENSLGHWCAVFFNRTLTPGRIIHRLTVARPPEQCKQQNVVFRQVVNRSFLHKPAQK